jgi:hypothetical protein
MGTVVVARIHKGSRCVGQSNQNLICIRFFWKLSNEIGNYRENMRKLSVLVCLALLLSFAPIGSSAPNGIGSAGNEGCSCHGASFVPNNESFDFTVEGVPTNFSLNTSYTITITMDNGSLVDNNSNGFRMIASQGVISADFKWQVNSHVMDEGATQTSDGKSTNVWNFTWTSPPQADGDVEFNTFVLLGSGGDGAARDYWIGKTNNSSPMDNNTQEDEEPEEIPFVGMFATASAIGLAFVMRRDDL